MSEKQDTETKPGLIQRFREEFSFIRGNLLVLTVSWTLFGYGWTFSRLYQSLMLRELGVSPTMMGLLNTVSIVVAILVKVPGSYIADRYGRVDIVRVFSFGDAVFFLILALTPDWRYALIGLTIYSLCAFGAPAGGALKVESVPADRRAMGFISMGFLSTLTSLMAPVVASFFIEGFGVLAGLRAGFMIAAVLSFVASVNMFLRLEETLEVSERFRLQDLSGVFRSSIKSLIEVPSLASKELKFLMVYWSILVFQDCINTTYEALFVIDVNLLSEVEWGLLNTYSMALGFILAYPGGKLIEKLGNRKALLLAYSVFIPLGWIKLFVRGFYPRLIIRLIGTVGGTLFPALYVIEANLTPSETRGRIIGVTSIMMSFSRMAASLIGGFLYDFNPLTPFILTGLLDIASVGILLYKIKEPAHSS